MNRDPNEIRLADEDLKRLEHRAALIRERPRRLDDDADLFWYAEFPVGNDRFALPLWSLRGALPLRLVTPLPLAPPHVLGVVRFLGAPVTVVSLASLLGIRGWREDPSVLVVAELEGARRLAFDAEKAPRAVTWPRTAIEKAWSNGKGPFAELSTPDGGLVTLLDLAQLLASRERELGS